ALAVAESDVLLFDRLDEADGRHRLAAAFATAPDVLVARDRAQRTAVSLRRLWQS
ncbi:MAG: phosphoribosylglycinamide formyltransferase 2, partial [Mycobacterium sp.]